MGQSDSSSLSSVAVIVLNWNGARFLDDAIASLREQDYARVSIYVADNGSTDDSDDVARRLGVQFLALGSNYGFAKGNNLAARQVPREHEYLLFVNNDMRFKPSFVRALVRVLESDKSLFACDAKQLSWDGSRQVHGANRLHWSLQVGGMFPFLVYRQDDDRGLVLWGNGGNLLVRRAMFDELGGFCDRLRFDLEDFDLCCRTALRGWRTVYEPDAEVFHRVSASFGSPSVRLERIRSRSANEIHVALRLLPIPIAFLVLFRSVARLPWSLVRYGPRVAWARGRGLLEALLASRTSIRERRGIYQQASIGPWDLVRLGQGR